MKPLDGNDNNDKLRLDRHPCFSETAHMKYGRTHIAVAPMCNISCKYCLRALNKTEDRPGVALKILTPEEAMQTIEDSLKLYPITVVGIAGPGESLVNRETFETFRLVDERHPELLKCLSSNGLLLAGSIEELKKIHVDNITVTVNTLRPETGARIYNFVNFEGKRYEGKEAAEILIKKQIEGVKAAVKAGFIVKINTVLIPGVNDNEVEEIAKFYGSLGAAIMNIIPLIPIHDMQGMKPPTCEELQDARNKCTPYVTQFHKCRQCRADAVGVPGLHGAHNKGSADTEYFHG